MAWHDELTGDDAIHPSAYIQSSDPGAVGANKQWIDTTTGSDFSSGWVLNIRNAGNTAWTTALNLSGGLAVTGSFDVFDGDKPEASPNTLDDDFTSSTISGNFTLVNNATTGAVVDADTTKKRHLYMKARANDGDIIHCALETIPSGDFVYQTHVKVLDSNGNFPFAGLCAANGTTAGAGSQAFFAFERDTGWRLEVYNWANFNSATGGGVSSATPFYSSDFLDLHLRLERSGTTLTLSCSVDGEVFEDSISTTETAIGFTITNLGPAIRNSASVTLKAAFKYVRYHATPSHKFGGMRSIATL